MGLILPDTVSSTELHKNIVDEIVYNNEVTSAVIIIIIMQ
jgi:hypothetical protein